MLSHWIEILEHLSISYYLIYLKLIKVLKRNIMFLTLLIF